MVAGGNSSNPNVTSQQLSKCQMNLPKHFDSVFLTERMSAFNINTFNQS